MFQGRIQDFKLGGGGHLKKLRRAEGGAKIFGVFRVKSHNFTPKNHIFSNCRGRRETFGVFRPPPPPESAPVFCRSLFVLLYFFFWLLCYLFFLIWILITPWYLQTLLTNINLANRMHIPLVERNARDSNAQF